jgi:flagellar hook-length control protein FliK
MVTRELLSLQSILGSFSAKTTGATSTQTAQSSDNSSFSALLKSKQSSGTTTSSNAASSSTTNDSGVNKATSDNAIATTGNDAADTNETAEASSKQQVETASETKAKTKTETETSEKTSTDDSKLAQLKERLKKATGLDDDEIDMLMAIMGPAFQQVIEQLPETVIDQLDLTKLADIANTLQNIEINQLLQEPVDETMLTQLTEQISEFTEVLKSAMEGETASADFESLLDKINAQAEAVVEAVSENEGKSVKDILSEMKASKPSETVEAKLSTSTDAEEATVEQTTSQMASDEQSTAEEETTETANVSTKLTAVSEKTNEDTETDTVDSDQDLMMTNQTQDQKFVDTVIRNMETKQVPRQEVLTQVMDSIKANLTVSENGSQMLIKLQPEQLGDVEVKVSMHKGVVLAEIKVENETVKAAIETNLDQLKNALSQKGYNTNQISVAIDSGKKEDGGASYNQWAQAQKQNSKIEIEDETSFLEKLTTGYVNDGLYETSTIDYFG